jgi:hypothetical protein
MNAGTVNVTFVEQTSNYRSRNHIVLRYNSTSEKKAPSGDEFPYR